MIKNIFFDFDGVLAESVNVKTEAFRQLYMEFGKEIADKVVTHHLANGGISRFEKIKLYHQDFLNIALSDAEIQLWAQKFSDLVLDGVVNASEVKGSAQFLEEHGNKYNSWIITGTPTNEIKEILNKRGWNLFFIEAFGSPEKKQHWTEHIISTEKLEREQTVFIGDALADQVAADFSNLHFILRETDENKSLFSSFKGPRIADLTQLENTLSKLK